ncbi:MAG TPA: ferric reductase-like transmembrane domain-containing protein [Candidatus Dormibacteraeota bacterium]|jgi:sulfoxide reductase heme-binding subunit YedZ|nr:ferric reductase-like transmembrane domain-containing protein [Candidatus Dormibacteraeota bacterium]
MNDMLLWYTARAAGLVSLVFLTAVVVLGVLARLRVEGRSWPRFLTAAVHRDLALMTLVFLALHIVTAVVDPFTHLGLTAVAVPFGSYYRPFWLGLGTISLYLLLAVVATSLLRKHIGARVWRGVHWASYALWPAAVVHGLGTGTDAFTIWSLAITIACVATVAGSLVWRLEAGPGDPLAAEKRAAVRTAGGER